MLAAQHLGGRDGAGVRRHQRVHGGEGAGGRERVQKQRSAEPSRDRHDDRQEDDQAGVEEDRETEQQRRDAQRKRRALLAETGR